MTGEDTQMHRRATAIRDFYRQQTYTVVPTAEHELWHPNYLQAIKTALDRLKNLTNIVGEVEGPT